ncbi:hypothetical protein O181_044891 [Austropuccinia psidii MF-1]|uniref:Uncharacterized protein n=1 Tax=Austropuccinia psidii MF-1 TaxID=1389203 RepID=A0A9Q3DRA1_9BASI|nr:hypothetical protein [Austropuccinia psidii MF-1]
MVGITKHGTFNEELFFKLNKDRNMTSLYFIHHNPSNKPQECAEELPTQPNLVDEVQEVNDSSDMVDEIHAEEADPTNGSRTNALTR